MRNTTHLTMELAVLWDELFEAVASITTAASRIDVLAAGLKEPSAERFYAETAHILEACTFRNQSAERIAKIAGELVRVDQFGRGDDDDDLVLKDNSIGIAENQLDVQHMEPDPVAAHAGPVEINQDAKKW
jgi:hypothetical protein